MNFSYQCFTVLTTFLSMGQIYFFKLLISGNSAAGVAINKYFKKENAMIEKFSATLEAFRAVIKRYRAETNK